MIRLLAGEEAADQPRPFAAAAVIDAHQLAFGLGLHEAAGGHGFEVRLARHEMHVVLRKQDNLTGLHLARWTVADRNEHRAFGDEVIGDDVRGLAHELQAVL